MYNRVTFRDGNRSLGYFQTDRGQWVLRWAILFRRFIVQMIERCAL